MRLTDGGDGALFGMMGRRRSLFQSRFPDLTGENFQYIIQPIVYNIRILFSYRPTEVLDGWELGIRH